jgi:serine/threonine protein kinase
LSDGPTSESLEGTILDGNYTLGRRISSGGMGDVYEATHSLTKRLVAIKLVRAELVGRGELRERVLREARAMAAVRSEHVAGVLDAGLTDDGSPYLVMERLFGEDLRQLLVRRGQLLVSVAVDIATQIARGLADVHAAGIVHRDLKPGNVFLEETPTGLRVKLLDFGVSKLESPGESTLTTPDLVLGSPHYMAPEQVQASHEADARADLYSFGVILFRMLTGTFPILGKKPGDILIAVMRDPPRRVGELLPSIDPALDAIVARCLEKDPTKRFASADELVTGLSALSPSLDTPQPRSSQAPLVDPSQPTRVDRKPRGELATPSGNSKAEAAAFAPSTDSLSVQSAASADRWRPWPWLVGVAAALSAFAAGYAMRPSASAPETGGGPGLEGAESAPRAATPAGPPATSLPSSVVAESAQPERRPAPSASSDASSTTSAAGSSSARPPSSAPRGPAPKNLYDDRL